MKLYQPIISEIVKELLKSKGLNKKERNRLNSLSFYSDMLVNDDRLYESDISMKLVDIFSFEFLWLDNGAPTIVIPDQETFDALMNIKFVIKDARCLEPPKQLFSIVYPEGTKYNGIELPNALYNFGDIEQYLSSLTDALKNNGQKESDFSISSALDHNEHLQLIFRNSSNASKSPYSLGFSPSKVVEALSYKNPERFKKYIVKEHAKNENSKISSEFATIEFALIRIYAALCLFLKAVPDGLVKGVILPEDKKSFILKNPELLSIDKKYFSDNESSNKVGVHIRHSHVRQLVHEKFYRGKYADLVVGSRVILMNDMLIGKAELSTVKKNKVKEAMSKDGLELR